MRLNAIISTLKRLDIWTSTNTAVASDLLMYRLDILHTERADFKTGKELPLINQLIKDADEALTRGPYSVIDKKSLPPSGQLNDYWHPAPYWWPNPKKNNGLPYIHRDGKRVPGTRLYELESELYDRSRLQRVFDDSIMLALAWYFTNEIKYAEHGARILERFFITPETRMSPHLKYAQVKMGRNNNQGSSTGIIEMKDMYYYLDAVRLFKIAGVITEVTINDFKEWLATYVKWLVQSSQGKRERISANNHGTYYDLQIAAIADFLNDHSLLYETIIRAQSRIAQQFSAFGSQPQELKRQTTAHYCCFNLQGWINLAKIASRWGTDFWSYEASNGASLIKGAQWLLSHHGTDWPYKQIDKFDAERYSQIWFDIPRASLRLQTTANFPKSKYSVKSRFYPHDGIRPYWNLGLNEGE